MLQVYIFGMVEIIEENIFGFGMVIALIFLIFKINHGILSSELVMAILISNNKARSKGAVTIKPFANFTFTKSLFILEDPMEKARSRQIARKRFKEAFWPEMPKEVVVHHKDENPFNNEFDNLELMELPKHISHHLLGKIRKSTLRKLESLLVLINER